MRQTLAQRIGIICIFLSMLLAASLTMHREVRAATGQTVSMDFKSVDIHVLIKFISQLTGKNFIVDRAVNGRVTVYSPTQISVDQAYKVFLSILEVNSFTVVPAEGGMYKILPLQQAKNRSIRTLPDSSKQYFGDEIVTQIITLKHSSAAELGKLLPTILGDRGTVIPYLPNNTLVVTAPHSLLKRVEDITREVDKLQYAPQFKTYFVKHGSASQIVSEINKLMTAMAKEREKTGHSSLALLEADNRVNKVLVLADTVSMKTVERMIQQLDAPTPKGKGDIHMVRLENADAEDTAEVLNTLISKDAASASSNKDDPEKTQALSKDVRVVADKPTNSLLITAQPGDFEILSNIIAQLDELRSQIFIEALIMEVSSEANFNFGINWAGGGHDGDLSFFGSTNPGGSGTISFAEDPDIVSFPSGLSLGMLFNDAIKVGGVSYGIPAILNLTQSDSDFRILSTPQLMTLDNQEAQVDVVDNIPFVKQVTTSAVTDDYQSQGIDYRDVGVKLKITPHIGSKGTLRLEIDQEVSRVKNEQVTTGDGSTILAPSTKKRTVKTTIQMRDRETVVIAGLISEEGTTNNAQVPGLGDVPGLGWLFKSKSDKDSRTNLFIFITPRVIDSYKESNEVALEKRAALQDIERRGPVSLTPKASQVFTPSPVMVR